MEGVDEAACDFLDMDGAYICGRPFCWEERRDESEGIGGGQEEDWGGWFIV